MQADLPSPKAFGRTALVGLIDRDDAKAENHLAYLELTARGRRSPHEPCTVRFLDRWPTGDQRRGRRLLAADGRAVAVAAHRRPEGRRHCWNFTWTANSSARRPAKADATGRRGPVDDRLPAAGRPAEAVQPAAR